LLLDLSGEEYCYNQNTTCDSSKFQNTPYLLIRRSSKLYLLKNTKNEIVCYFVLLYLYIRSYRNINQESHIFIFVALRVHIHSICCINKQTLDLSFEVKKKLKILVQQQQKMGVCLSGLGLKLLGLASTHMPPSLCNSFDQAHIS
jgi:hypothetical protein